MAPIEPIARGRVSLVDAVDHLLNRGAVLSGDATLSIAGIDLVYVGLNLLVSSVETLEQRGDWRWGTRAMPPRGPTFGRPSIQLSTDTDDADELVVPEPPAGCIPSLLPKAPVSSYGLVDLDRASDPSDPVDGVGASSLVRLVLTLVELLRQLVERQALRRVEGTGLSDDQVEQMGRALKELSEKMGELRELFGLQEGDLAIDLGPLGRLV